MKTLILKSIFLSATVLALTSCNDSDTDAVTNSDNEEITATLHTAFSEFDSDNVTVTLQSNSLVKIESNSETNHTSPYWSENHALYSEVDTDFTTEANMAPNNTIDGNAETKELYVSTSPSLASNSSSTSLGPIGISVTGTMIYNQNEAGNSQIDSSTASGLDRNGGHVGPATYHYHMEPISVSQDDDALIGVIADGFFVYGRKCNSTGTYPTDLDSSNGHTSVTEFSDGEEEYHYHIANETIYDRYYVLFTGDYEGTPYSIK
ncbi:YHYH protein [Flavobacteriaceae bacterium]|nr:YHYH protein [Flavobacteriaceae bacterium]